MKKCEWVGQNGLIASIGVSDRYLSIWHPAKPNLQQYIIKGPSNSIFQDFEWLEPGKKLISLVSF